MQKVHELPSSNMCRLCLLMSLSQKSNAAKGNDPRQGGEKERWHKKEDLKPKWENPERGALLRRALLIAIPIQADIVYLDLYWGPSILGDYHIDTVTYLSGSSVANPRCMAKHGRKTTRYFQTNRMECCGFWHLAI